MKLCRFATKVSMLHSECFRLVTVTFRITLKNPHKRLIGTNSPKTDGEHFTPHQQPPCGKG
jgi:hypothetical protein